MREGKAKEREREREASVTENSFVSPTLMSFYRPVKIYRARNSTLGFTHTNLGCPTLSFSLFFSLSLSFSIQNLVCVSFFLCSLFSRSWNIWQVKICILGYNYIERERETERERGTLSHNTLRLSIISR